MPLEHGHAAHGPGGKIEVTTPGEAAHLIEHYDTFLFDCDGVIWINPAGDTLTENIIETLSYLRSLGKKVAFITNNATSSRKKYHKKFQGFGIDVKLEEIFTCGSATAEYLRDEVLPRREKEGKPTGVYLIGQEAMEEEFESCGLKWTGGTDPEDDVLLPPQDFSSITPDPSIGVVVYGFQMRINYKQLAKAYNYLASNPDCELILTNDDQNFLLPGGGYAPGEGAIASVLFGALPKDRKPLIVGKPHQPLLDIVHSELRFDIKRTIFVGDRLATDILFAKRGQIDSLLVLTGIQKREDLDGLKEEETPEWVADCVGTLLKAREVLKDGVVRN
ncbi:uncharacterized protein JCM6883_001970 [Sporobolomyces salmoneus]|uniref:uncharacterized protein n=1 Tax=Sporobolomyces salmoneus TaxID=183962 RepID=UPI00316CCD88